MVAVEKENTSFAYQRFKQLRIENNLSEYEVSKGTGISTTVLTQWSRGDYNLKLDKLKAIADFFSVPLTDLIE